jgi:hypothetical protein
VLVSLVALVVVFSLLDLPKFFQAIQQANLLFLLLGTLFSLIWLIIRGFFWRTLLQNKATFRDSFITINEGYLLNNILPFRLGEIARAYLLGRKAGLDFWQVVPSILIERALDLAIAAGLFLSTLPFVIGVAWAAQAAIATGILVAAGMALIYFVALNRTRILGRVEKLGQRYQLVKKLAGRRVVAFFDGLMILTDARLFLKALGWEGLNWLVGILQYYFFLKAFFPDPNLLWACFALGIGALGIALPSSPGAIGVFEATLVGALYIFGIQASPAAAFALSMHIISYLLTGIIGGYGLYKDGESLFGLYSRLGRMKSEGEI